MKLLRHLNVVIALALAVLLPLEQAHCMFMGLQKRSAPVAANAPVHPCCARAAAQAGHHAPAQVPLGGCNCPVLPSVVLAASVHVPAAHVTAIAQVIPAVFAPAAPVPLVTRTARPPDAGSSPLPYDAGAHGLRAPPVSA